MDRATTGASVGNGPGAALAIGNASMRLAAIKREQEVRRIIVVVEERKLYLEGVDVA